MKHFNRQDIAGLESRFRANLINTASGYKPVSLIGTVSKDGVSNLAIFNSAIHIGANPPLIGLIFRPVGEVPRHTYENIKASGEYTLNHVSPAFAERAHYTSAKFPKEVSEFDACGFTKEFVDGFAAPFVKESIVKIGLRFTEEIEIKLNGTILLIGEIQHLILPDEAILENGSISLDMCGSICSAGLNSYGKVSKIADYPYATPENLPEFL